MLRVFIGLLLLIDPEGKRCCTECSAPSSVGLPILPTDSVGALPPDQDSPKLQKLFKQASSSTTRMRIRFTQVSMTPNSSFVETTTREKIAALRADLDRGQREVAIGHELSHILLQARGFASMVHTPPGSSDLLQQLGAVVTSCVDDALIDRQLAARGFSPELLNRDTIERLNSHPAYFAPHAFDDPIVKDGNALLIVCFSFRKRYHGNDIEPYWQQRHPEVVARARELMTKIGDIHCRNADSCLARKIHIRNVLGYPITFCNPFTGKFE